VRFQTGPGLRLFQTEESRPCLDDRHLGAKASESLAQLQPDGSASEDRERDRQLAGQCRLTVRPVLDGIEAGNRRNRRCAAVGDHHSLARDIALAGDLDGFVIDQLAVAAHQRRAG